MGILDRLKPQPRWKHADPAVRLEAVRELEDPAEVAILAETDADARVRKACLARTSDPVVLSRIAAQDSDLEARDRAADRLLVLATAADGDQATRLTAVRGITDVRRLSAIARTDACDAVRADALSRVSDDRALGSIARHAKRETTAAEALARLIDAKELLDAALNSDHKDVALAAFDRVVAGGTPDLALLRSIESRAQQRAVAKRARTMVQEIEAAEAARVAAEEEHRRQQGAVLDAIEHLADVRDIDRAQAELVRLTVRWEELAVSDEAAAGRFDRGREAAAAAIAERQEEAERARVRDEALATGEALCARADTLDGDDALEQLAPLEEEWRSLTPLVGDSEAARVTERLASAIAGCRKRHEQRAHMDQTRAQLDALVVEAEALVTELAKTELAKDDAGAAVPRWSEISREARLLAEALEQGLRPVSDLTGRLSAVGQEFAARETARREAAQRAHEELVAKLQRLLERATRATEADSVTLREGERLMRDLSAGLEEASHGEPTRELQDAMGRVRSIQEKVAPRVRELREMDEWRRFANAQQQEQLIAMAEAIVASLKSDVETGKDSDLIATARALRELNAKWQEVAEAPRHSAQRLWERFRTATDVIRRHCEGYFAKLREERGTNLQKKTSLVEEAEVLAVSTDWAKGTARFQELQTEWQQLGPVPRDAARDLAHRFRTACNQFFLRRREDLTARKKAWAENLARKEALCERAETLVASMEWESASAEMKRLQTEWKAIGPVRRNRSEIVWNRFRAAADSFFERYHNRHQIAIQSKLAEREAIVVDLESVASMETAEAPPELAVHVQELRNLWNRGVPVPASEMRPLADRWHAAFARVLERWPAAFGGTDLDPSAVQQRMAKLVARVEALAADSGDRDSHGRSQTEILAARLRSALASNAMGGRVNDESKWQTAADTVKDAQAAWLRLPPAAGAEVRTLEARFRDACRRVLDHVKRRAGESRRTRQTAQAV